jgi:phospholipase C
MHGYARALSVGAAVGLLALMPGTGLADSGTHGDRGSAHAKHGVRDPKKLAKVDRVVVIYEENHSFDNLYGGWERVEGRDDADAAHTTQVDQAGAPYACLPQNDLNIAPACPPNEPFAIEDYIPAEARTCPDGVKDPTGKPGGCTRDLVHRFYQEQYQLNGGMQNRYTTGSDAEGLTQGYYRTRNLPIYRYLHGEHHQRYAIADHFFQAAFGGSFLNHQWLIAAATPTWPGGPADQHSIVDSNGMPTTYPLYTPTGTVADKPLTQTCPATVSSLLCGDYAVNTIQPPYQPYSMGPGGTPPAVQLPPQTHATIGDRLSAAGVDWAWYSGGWSNANGDIGAPGWTNGTDACTDPATATNSKFPNCPNKYFQYHHQPFNYFANYAPGTAARTAHLRDEQEFLAAAKSSQQGCALKPVSFIKPIGLENEHPGYASEHQGSDHLVDLLKAVNDSGCAKRTMVVVTYDEFGGQWDHVPPPGQGDATPGPADQHGPGTRIPALVLSPGIRGGFVVDRASHDTTSIVSTIEHRFGLAPLTSRDAAVQDLSTVFSAK